MELELILSGFATALQPQNLMFIMIGLLFGVFVGSLPGMTATMGVAVMVPFSYYLEADAAMLLIAISLAWPLISAQIKKLRTRKAP